METRPLIVAVVALLGTTMLAAAQTPSDAQTNIPPHAQPDRARIEGQPLTSRIPGIERLFGVLTDEQRASLRQAMEAQRERMRGLEEKLRDARKELFEAGLKEKFDEEVVRQKAMAAAKLDAELAVLRAKAFSQMRPPLSAEQLEKLRNQTSVGPVQRQGERLRQRPEVQRDEHGLPPKDRGPAEQTPK